MSVADPRCAMLFELSQCAHRLGMGFGAEAERAEDAARRLEYFQLFDRCFFAVRVGIALELRLQRAPAAASEALAERNDSRDSDDPAEFDRPESDPSEHERPERLEYERDREREVERASLPLLLRTLEGVVADAASLPGPEPADLPTLRELLRHVVPKEPAPTRSRTDLRARLAGSGAASALALAPLAPFKPGGALPVRRATGPPRH